MMGVFVQVNTDSERARSHPVGYIITERGCWEWVGAFEVVLRRTHPGNRAAVNAAKRYCASGHVLDETNTYIRPDGYRQCRACARRWSRESAARQTQR